MAMPKRELFKAPEVCEMAQLQPYVLRTWESEFPKLGQASSSGGRIYRRADVEKVLQIKQLVFGEGLTLAGARRRLEEGGGTRSVAAVAVDDVLGDLARTRLREVRKGLEAILKLLGGERTSGMAPELELVAPVARRIPKSAAKAAAGKRKRVS
jgi:DNA-binding transcriptional MerR regulator